MAAVKREIVQLVASAPGWFARYYDPDAPRSDGEETRVQVACWALVTETGGNGVAGPLVVVGVGPTDDSKTQVGLLDEPDSFDGYEFNDGKGTTVDGLPR